MEDIEIYEEPIEEIVMPAEEPIGVYIRIDEDKNIVEVNSDVFIADLSSWIKVDEGFGDKYAHAQSQYFEKPLIDEGGKYCYAFKRNKVVENK